MEASIVEVDSEELVGELKRNWKTLMVLGCLALFAGVVCIFVPEVATVTIGVFVGWLLIFGAVLQFVDAFSVRETGRVVLRMIGAVITLGIGLWIISSPLKGTFTLTVILGIWFLASGVFRLIAAWRERGNPGAGLLGLNGALALIGIILSDLQSTASWAIGLLVGIDLIFAGIALIVTANAAKNA